MSVSQKEALDVCYTSFMVNFGKRSLFPVGVFLLVCGVVFVVNLKFHPHQTAQTSATPQSPPQTAQETRAHWRTILHWSDDCESSWQSSQATGVDISQLNNDEFVVLVTCNIAAYQKNVAVYYYNQTQKVVKPQHFLTMYEDAHHHLLKSTTTYLPLNPP